MATTETISPNFSGLDTWPDEAILAAFSDGQEKAIAAVRGAHPSIAEAARAIAKRSGDSGRLIYVGAGSSGVIAALDGIELGGTFGWPDDRVAFVLANGPMLEPGLAGAPEDDVTRARAAVAALKPTSSAGGAGIVADVRAGEPKLKSRAATNSANVIDDPRTFLFTIEPLSDISFELTPLLSGDVPVRCAC